MVLGVIFFLSSLALPMGSSGLTMILFFPKMWKKYWEIRGSLSKTSDSNHGKR